MVFIALIELIYTRFDKYLQSKTKTHTPNSIS